MEFEKILCKEFGKENVELEYLRKNDENILKLIIHSRDGKKEFKADEILLIEDSFELGGKKYSIEEFIKALNNSFNRNED